jgi:hypothetical protein
MEGTMPSMETLFLTIGEAAKKTGRSASTIRRFIHLILDQEKHPDRSAIEPSPAKAASFKKKGEIFAWRIREDILDREFSSALKEEKKETSSPSPDVLSILERELTLKNQHIEKQWEVIHSLNERLREGNILMGSLQKRLAPPESPAPKEEIVEATPVNPSTEASKKNPVEAVKKAKKKSFLSWLGFSSKKTVHRN